MAPNWSDLRWIGNSWISKVTIFVPIVGYSILFNDTILHFLEVSDIISVVPSNDDGGIFRKVNSLKIYFVYFGLVLFGVAATSYQIFCHSIVKKYADAEEYAETIGRTSTQSEIKLALKDIERTGYISGDNKLIFDGYKKNFQAEDMLKPNAKEANHINILKMKYNVLSNYRKISRTVVVMLYLIGSFFLLVPSIISFTQVFLSFIKKVAA